MKLKLHSEGHLESLKQISADEKKELESVKHLPLPEKMKETFRIRTKYLKLRGDVKRNLYINS